MKCNEIYFCLKLTEAEHTIISEELKSGFDDSVIFHYYRKLKNGHIPLYREVKLSGEIYKVKEYLNKNCLNEYVVPNPYK